MIRGYHYWCLLNPHVFWWNHKGFRFLPYPYRRDRHVATRSATVQRCSRSRRGGLKHVPVAMVFGQQKLGCQLGIREFKTVSCGQFRMFSLRWTFSLGSFHLVLRFVRQPAVCCHKDLRREMFPTNTGCLTKEVSAKETLREHVRRTNMVIYWTTNIDHTKENGVHQQQVGWTWELRHTDLAW